MAADFLITSTRGGLCEDDPTSIADDQCTEATNVEWCFSQLGERRPGADAVLLTGSPVEDCVQIAWLHRHTPTSDPLDEQLWVLGLNDVPGDPVLCYRDQSGWTEIDMPDALTLDGISEYSLRGLSLHGKLFIAYNSTVDRLHVFIQDDTALRRTGLDAPAAAPTGADGGGAGSLTGTRYYRVRFTEQISGTTVRRSEPSAVLTKTPDGSHANLTITKPADISEGETHWELEASTDNENFYRIATTVIGTTTATDTVAYSTGYAANGLYEISEDSGDYSLIPSVKYLAADRDKLIAAGSWENEAFDSRVLWTPLPTDPGVGDDERAPIDIDSYVNLDSYEGGAITGLVSGVNGYVFASKQSHLYQLTATGERQDAYEAFALTKERGAMPGSLVRALDMTGNPVPFGLDPGIGPWTITDKGVTPCGKDLVQTWATVISNPVIPTPAVYYPYKQQVQWWVITDGSRTDYPNARLVLHTQQMRMTRDGLRGGWAVWRGTSCGALTATLARTDQDGSLIGTPAPYVGIDGGGLLLVTDTGTQDDGDDYFATLTTKPYVHGSLINQFECQSAALLATATAGAILNVTIVGNFGLTVKPAETLTFDPEDTEGHVVRILDDVGLAELRTIQVSFTDPETPGEQWRLEQMTLRETGGSTGG